MTRESLAFAACQNAATTGLTSESICPTPDSILEHLNDLSQDAQRLAQFGSFSVAIYDTAWVSMVSRDVNDSKEWLFPEAFEYILAMQNNDGTWPKYTSDLDAILNTLASLLSLLTHRKAMQTASPSSNSLDSRIARACAGLQSLLSTWDVDGADNVAFELIVMALLTSIEQFGYIFDFSDRSKLTKLYTQKMQKFSPAIVYSNEKTTILHSLEALQGFIDFDRVSHHCNEQTGICGSPASTAAYLINTSVWDIRAEAYLSHVIKCYKANGGVPNAYPTCIFELSWAISILRSVQAHTRQWQDGFVTRIAGFLRKSLSTQNGIVGFAEGVVADADDSARVLIALQRLGYSASADPIIQHFQSTGHFRTYARERNPSFSANCNVLLALLETGDINRHREYVERIVTYLVQACDKGGVKDKWNYSSDYSHMLLSEAFICLLKKFDNKSIAINTEVALQKIPLILCQTLSRSIKHQLTNGSWHDEVEVTAYNVLLIAQCMSLPWMQETRNLLEQCMQRGQAFISSNYGDPSKSSRLWIEKTTYQSGLLKTVYCSAALNVDTDQQYHWSDELANCFKLSPKTQTMRKLFNSLPLFHEHPLHNIELVTLEATMYSRLLRKTKCRIVARDQVPMTKDKYLEFIPMIWVACNSIAKEVLSADNLWDMMLISLLNYQMDEYMESVVAFLDDSSLAYFISAIDSQCKEASSSLSHCDRKGGEQSPEPSRPENSVKEVDTIVRYINHILKHPLILQSPSLTQRELAIQLQSFLMAHIHHNRVNSQHIRRRKRHFESSLHLLELKFDYFEWVRSTGANDTSCPFSFWFFSCLISSPGAHVFASVEANYVGKSLARHLATMCRQYNDYGSVQRDADEGNLNSLDFPEFDLVSAGFNSQSSVVSTKALHTGVTNGSNGDHGLTRVSSDESTASSLTHNEEKKASLKNIAEFERRSTMLCLKTLQEQQLASEKAIHAIEIFVNVTDAFGQVYEQKDIASRVLREHVVKDQGTNGRK